MTMKPPPPPWKGYPDLDCRCTVCGPEEGTYMAPGICENCGRKYALTLSRGHELPTSYKGAECASCGCRKVIGLR